MSILLQNNLFLLVRWWWQKTRKKNNCCIRRYSIWHEVRVSAWLSEVLFRCIVSKQYFLCQIDVLWRPTWWLSYREHASLFKVPLCVCLIASCIMKILWWESKETIIIEFLFIVFLCQEHAPATMIVTSACNNDIDIQWTTKQNEDSTFWSSWLFSSPSLGHSCHWQKRVKRLRNRFTMIFLIKNATLMM